MNNDNEDLNLHSMTKLWAGFATDCKKVIFCQILSAIFNPVFVLHYALDVHVTRQLIHGSRQS